MTEAMATTTNKVIARFIEPKNSSSTHPRVRREELSRAVVSFTNRFKIVEDACSTRLTGMGSRPGKNGVGGGIKKGGRRATLAIHQ